ncbi:MAG: molybdenum cofactor biosynthesis protein B [Oligoflexus sp.]
MSPEKALKVSVLTVSDSRSKETDRSGQSLVQGVETAGHQLANYEIVADNLYLIRAIVATWIADSNCDAIITTGGTGLTGRDVTPEAVQPLLDRDIAGFGELFRHLSYEDIGSSTMLSRAFAGLANGTLVFCLPGSTGACELAWKHIIAAQLDHETKPCNFAQLIPRLKEH